MKIAIIIPARYGSTRFPGKPLTLIGGQSMLSRVVTLAQKAIDKIGSDITLAVATEDQRIADHASEIGVPCLMTSDNCATGSDRVLEAVDQLQEEAGSAIDFVLGLQGDAPFTPIDAPIKMIEAFQSNSDLEVITPIINLRWSELDKLREQKKVTPFSGTTCVTDSNGKALWFSKNIIPAIRQEEKLYTMGEFSPVFQHIGLYGYRTDILRKFVSLPQGHYEQLEGLEQLRLLENGITIQTIKLNVPLGLAQAGIDSPEDVTRAEAMLKAMSS